MDSFDDGPVNPLFPFSAVVGNENIKKGMICALASPSIRTVLICGPTGTGKSTIARSVYSISKDRKIIVIPSGVTEDRIFGSMDVESTIKEGKCKVDRSLISRADGNILLIENINLVRQDLLHQILNIAETGKNTVERDGISTEEYCDTLVICTMDPSEGDVNEHILDRFDMCLFTSNIQNEEEREDVILNVLEYTEGPEEFVKKYSSKDGEIAESISESRKKFRLVGLPEGYCRAISQLCSELNISGHRGDLAVMNAARSLASLDGREMAGLDDLKTAASFCLDHRRRDSPDDDYTPPKQSQNDETDSQEPENNANDDRDSSQNEHTDSPLPPLPEQKNNDIENTEQEEEIFTIGETFRLIDYIPPAENKLKTAKAGRRKGSEDEDPSGRCIGYRIPKGKIRDIALCASIRAASPYQILRDHSELAIVLKHDDLREKIRESKRGNDILFLVDGSGSIGAQKRMVSVKGAVLSMLKDAYQKRDRVGMVVFRKDSAEEVLPLTKSTLRAYNALAEIPTGGRTPLTSGLIKGAEILSRSSSGNPVMVIFSDGRCNQSFNSDRKPLEEMMEIARNIADSVIRFIVVDTESGKLTFGLAMNLCRELNGTYLRLDELNADNIFRSVRQTIDSL